MVKLSLCNSDTSLKRRSGELGLRYLKAKNVTVCLHFIVFINERQFVDQKVFEHTFSSQVVGKFNAFVMKTRGVYVTPANIKFFSIIASIFPMLLLALRTPNAE